MAGSAGGGGDPVTGGSAPADTGTGEALSITALRLIKKRLIARTESQNKLFDEPFWLAEPHFCRRGIDRGAGAALLGLLPAAWSAWAVAERERG